MNSVQAVEVQGEGLELVMAGLGQAAAESRAALALSSGNQRNVALLGAARAIRARAAEILAANARDMEAARARNLSGADARSPAVEREARRGDGRRHRADRGPA